MTLMPLLCLAVHMQAGAIPDPVAFAQPLVRLMDTEWPKNRTVTIVCHGHSVPAGYFKTPVVQSFDAYPHLLHQALKKRFPFAVVNVVVTAIGGEASDSGAERFERDVMSLKPDVVTIDYGLNDRRLGLDKARPAWETMIELAGRGGAKVILLTPSWDQSAPTADTLPEHAEQIRALAKKHGTGLADSFDAFLRATNSGTPLPSLMSQSNHPNRAGHELILQGLLPWFGLGIGR